MSDNEHEVQDKHDEAALHALTTKSKQRNSLIRRRLQEIQDQAAAILKLIGNDDAILPLDEEWCDEGH